MHHVYVYLYDISIKCAPEIPEVMRGIFCNTLQNSNKYNAQKHIY
jgi:hypothetical protein